MRGNSRGWDDSTWRKVLTSDGSPGERLYENKREHKKNIQPHYLIRKTIVILGIKGANGGAAWKYGAFWERAC